MKQSTPLKRRTQLKATKGFKITKSQFKPGNIIKKTSNPEIQEADSKFSKIIIERDGKCLNCGSPYFLSCSHFHGRSNFATRWDPLNCVTYCLPCHSVLESKKQGIYADFMETWLGRQRFLLLTARANQKVSKEDALKEAQAFIKVHYQESEIQY